MALTKEQKKKIVEDLKEKVARQKAMVFVVIEGLKTGEISDLRKRLKENNCLLKIAKKTLLNIVFEENKIEVDEDKLEGQLALIFGFGDEISPAKTAYQFSLEHEKLKIMGGFLENKFRESREIVNLAKIPSKEELLAQVVGCFRAPMANLAAVLQGNIKGLVYLLSSIKK